MGQDTLQAAHYSVCLPGFCAHQLPRSPHTQELATHTHTQTVTNTHTHRGAGEPEIRHWYPIVTPLLAMRDL
jgi:hypothetical protein